MCIYLALTSHVVLHTLNYSNCYVLNVNTSCVNCSEIQLDDSGTAVSVGGLAYDIG
jgi:hypothetical protein